MTHPFAGLQIGAPYGDPIDLLVNGHDVTLELGFSLDDALRQDQPPMSQASLDQAAVCDAALYSQREKFRWENDPQHREALEEQENEQDTDIRNYVEELLGKPAYTPDLIDQYVAWTEGYGPEPVFAWMLDCDTRGPTCCDTAHEHAALREEALR